MGRLIYVVDDEKNIRDLIKGYLIAEGYEVELFSNGQEAFDAFQRREPDMLVIDIMMPGMDGFTLCREIRKVSDVPIIIVSAKDETLDKVLGLELGSDDYIAKPFSPRELIARIKTIFRRIKSDTEEKKEGRKKVVCKDIVIYPDERAVYKGDIQIKLTTKEYDFLYYMVKNINCVFNREQLLNAVWGYDYYGDSRAIDDLVKRVRKKLSLADSTLEITTVWGYGYKISDEK